MWNPKLQLLRVDFREGDEDSNFSVFRVRRFSESPEPLHWIAFPVEILTKPPIHWIASPLFTENPFFSLKSASSHPLTKNRLWTSSRKLSRNYVTSREMPKILVLKAQGRHVMWHFLNVGAKIWLETITSRDGHFLPMKVLTKIWPNDHPGRNVCRGLVFCLRCRLLERQKEHVSAIWRQKRDKGRNKTEDQNWSCFFGQKRHFSLILSKICQKGRQKTRPWQDKLLGTISFGITNDKVKMNSTRGFSLQCCCQWCFSFWQQA